MNARPLLLLVGTSPAKAFREYAFAAASRHYRLWVLNPSPPTWENPYIVGYTPADCLDADKLTAVAREIARDHVVAGVWSGDEAYLEPTAIAGAALGLTRFDPTAVANCRDKSATRSAMVAAGLPQPASRPVASLDEARAFADEVGYPVILKPRNLGGSLGITRVSSSDALAAAFETTWGVRYPGVREFDAPVLIEKYLEGPEISVDCVLFDGACTPLVVAHKVLGAAGTPFEFEEVGHDVSGSDPLLGDASLLDHLERAHAALGFRNGVTHTEFKLTDDGPVLIEVNARVGGDMIPYLGQLASGVDEAAIAAHAMAGFAPPVSFAGTRRAASIRFFYPADDMEVTSVTVHSDAIRPPVHSVAATTAPGAKIHLPPRGLAKAGYVITVAATVDEAAAAAVGATDLFEVSGKPLGDT